MSAGLPFFGWNNEQVENYHSMGFELIFFEDVCCCLFLNNN